MSSPTFPLGSQGQGFDQMARVTASQALTLAQTTAASVPVYRHAAASGLVLKTWTAAGTTGTTGACTFTLPPGYFQAVTFAGPQAVRDTADPKLATFATLRTVTAAQIVVQCFESKTTASPPPTTTVEGLEVCGAGITVLLLAAGY